MGVDQTVAKRLIANRNFTPIIVTAIVAALETMKVVEGREIFVERAAAAPDRSIAWFARVHAELMADAFRQRQNLARFVALGDFPFLVTKDNRILTVVPIDALAWTRETAPRLTEAQTQGLKKRRTAYHRGGDKTGQAPHQGKRLSGA